MSTKFILITDMYGQERIINPTYIVTVGEGGNGAYVKLTDDTLIELTISVTDFHKLLTEN